MTDECMQHYTGKLLVLHQLYSAKVGLHATQTLFFLNLRTYGTCYHTHCTSQSINGL